MEVFAASRDRLDALVDCWVALAREQREHGSRLLAQANRDAVHQTLSEAVAAGDVLVATGEPPEDPDGAEGREADRGRGTDSGRETARGREAERVGEDVLGFANASVPAARFARDDVRGVVHNLYVRPPHRNRGVGSALLAAAEDHLDDAGADTVTLEAMAANEAAQRFYRRHGYEPHRVQYERALGSDTH